MLKDALDAELQCVLSHGMLTTGVHLPPALLACIRSLGRWPEPDEYPADFADWLGTMLARIVEAARRRTGRDFRDLEAVNEYLIGSCGLSFRRVQGMTLGERLAYLTPVRVPFVALSGDIEHLDQSEIPDNSFFVTGPEQEDRHRPVIFPWRNRWFRGQAALAHRGPTRQAPVHAHSLRGLVEVTRRDVDLAYVAKGIPLSDGAECSPTPTASGTEAQPVLPIVLGKLDDEPIVRGERKKRLTPGQYRVVKALLDAHPERTSKDTLANRSETEDPIGMIDRLRKDSDWATVLDKPGQPHGGYGIRVDPP